MTTRIVGFITKRAALNEVVLITNLPEDSIRSILVVRTRNIPEEALIESILLEGVRSETSLLRVALIESTLLEDDLIESPLLEGVHTESPLLEEAPIESTLLEVVRTGSNLLEGDPIGSNLEEVSIVSNPEGVATMTSLKVRVRSNQEVPIMEGDQNDRIGSRKVST